MTRPPRHLVTFAEPFAVGVYEVTFTQWDACHQAGGCSHDPDDEGWGRGTRPVVDVSWHDAQEYVRWLSSETGQDYRLLSESEWEYVARAGTTTRYWWGDEIGRNRANCDGCGSSWDGRQTAPVGSFRANAFGLHDMHGNVWEWVQDCLHDDYSGAPADGRAWMVGGNCSSRRLRGGSWEDLPEYLRSANRGWSSSRRRNFYEEYRPEEYIVSWKPVRKIGFRIARTLTTQKRHTLPLFRPAGHAQDSFARIINHSGRAGTVRITGIDDAGTRHGPTTLSLEAHETRHFNSRDFQAGNASTGLSGGLGNGQGNWRVELSTSLDIEPSAYIRMADGFFTPMHAVVRTRRNAEGAIEHHVPIFIPESDPLQRSWLRVTNRADANVAVTITGRDDDGEPGPAGDVGLTVPSGAARTLSAQQLESGGAGLSGRLGDGAGRWQLFVTATGPIEVMSLMQGPTGRLSNLSATTRGGFVIAFDGSTTVQPLEAIPLDVPGGLTDSDYTVFLDLSGTGAFGRDDTIEVEGLTTDEDQILFASPLTQALPEKNTTRRIAVRVRHETDGEMSNTLQFTVAEITIPASLAGFPTILLEVIQKSAYASADDPLLNAEAPSIHPGLLFASAKRLGLDTTFSDVQAVAILQSVFGISLEDIVESRASSSNASAPTPSAASRGGIGLHSSHAPQPMVTNPFRPAFDCVKEHLDQLSRDRAGVDCPNAAIWETTKGVINRVSVAAMSLLPLGVPAALAGPVIEGVQRLYERVNQFKFTFGNSNWLRLFRSPGSNNAGRHFTTKPSGSKELMPTLRGLNSNFNGMAARAKQFESDVPDLVKQTEKECAKRSSDARKREACANIINRSGSEFRKAISVEKYNGVLTGAVEPGALERDPGGDWVVARRCETGYQEFPLDKKTSTCVFQSLVEKNCYAGSRRVQDPNLGGANVCLYYSLDFFQANRTCRPKYAKVYFDGRETCRWAGLGADKRHWYTLNKKQDDEPPEPPKPPGGAYTIGYSQTTVAGPEGHSVVGYQITSIPRPASVPGRPDVSGRPDGWSGNYVNGKRDGIWFWFYDGYLKDFETYKAGIRHGPSGGYDRNGRPDEWFGNYVNGKRDGVWFWFYDGYLKDFETYKAGTRHGPSGGYDRNGRPDEWFGNYVNAKRDGVWFWFYDGYLKDFETYKVGTRHGPSGGYDRNGRPDEWFGNYVNAKRDGVWFWFYDGYLKDFETYKAGIKHGPSGRYNRDGERHEYFGSYSNGRKSGTWTWYWNGERRSTEEY